MWPLARAFATSFLPLKEAFDSSFLKLVGAPDTLLLVAEIESGIVGYLLAFNHGTFFANGPVAWVEELMVEESSRTTGIGRALMDEAESWARSIGAAYLSLATRRAADFYLALGYEDSATFFRKMLP